MKTLAATARPALSAWRDYMALTKPGVVLLIVFTALVGMLLAVPGWPPLVPTLAGTAGIALAAGGAAAINHLLDRRIDARMSRTRHRPLPRGMVSETATIAFATTLSVASMVILVLGTNVLTAVLTFASLIGYAILYTAWLKRATPQNIVIGGAAGAAPPVLGWTAVTGSVSPDALLLFLIIFAWTPPHFWALAIHRRDEYARVDIPMLPVTHGIRFTRWQILFYTVLLTVVTILPFLSGMSGPLYLAGALVLDLGFLWYALRLLDGGDERVPMKTFSYSITYLMVLFAFLLADHWFMRLVGQT